MTSKNLDTRQRITEVLGELKQGNSDLAVRCRTDSNFHSFVMETSEALAAFYEQMENNALDIFESKLRRWITENRKAYWGFAGELFVADWLRRHNVPHHFVRETGAHKTPDIKLVLKDKAAYLEIKTLKESFFDWFARRVLEEIEPFLPNRGIHIEELKPGEGMEGALIGIAVQKIKERPQASYSPIQYEGEEGQFSILLPPGKALWYWPESVDAKRVRKDGTPWAQSKLRELLEESAEKFESYEPGFLMWFVPQDFALCESVSSHIDQVLDQCGKDFEGVAGVVLLDSVHGGRVIENPSYKKRQHLKENGLLEAIRILEVQ
jgi:hypothetical protein